LTDRKIETYFQRLDVNPVNPRSNRQKPFFPGYMFVRGELGDLYAKKIGLLRGVGGLVNFDGIPASVPDSMIEVIKRQVEREQNRLALSPEHLRLGDRVWVDDPIFQGIEARFEQCINGEDRVAVLLSLLKGRTVRVQIDADKVKKRVF
jgi:transcriptional antiterminator RfaH